MVERLGASAALPTGNGRREFAAQSRADLASIVQAHEDWLDSRGRTGEQADLEEGRLAQASLARARLSGANARRARMAGANLEAADLSDADLSEASLGEARLAGANLRRSSLAGADLRGADLRDARLWDADLSDADLTGAGGLLAASLAGADLTGTKLPASAVAFDAVTGVDEASRGARRILLVIALTIVYSCLIAATTTDVDLLTNARSPLPVIGARVPLVWVYWAVPAILLGLYCYMHFYLQHLWRRLAVLPAVFPDGRRLDETVFPWPVSGLVSAHLHRLKLWRPPLSRIQTLLALVLAWWIVPLTLALFWGRYLMRQDWIGSGLQLTCLAAAVSFGLFSYLFARRTLRRVDWGFSWKRPWRDGRSCIALSSLAALAVLTVLTFGAVEGVRGPVMNPADPRGWVPRLLERGGVTVFADLRRAEVSRRDEDFWRVAPEQRATAIRGADLAGQSMRFADAKQAFFALADLRGADLKGADLDAANLESADLRSASLANANLARAALYSTKLEGADLRGANFENAALAGSNLQKAVLFGARGLTCRQLEQASRWEEALRDESLACGKPIPAPPPGLGAERKF